MFKWLEHMDDFLVGVIQVFGQMLLLFTLSLAGFGFYRIFYGVMMIKKRKKYIFYEDALPTAVQEDLRQRDESHRDPLAHIIPGIIWVTVSFLLGFLGIR